MTKLLSIEDDPVTRELIGHIFEVLAPDFSVSFAATFTDGLAQLRAGCFDLVLLDLVMPDAPKIPTNVSEVADAAGAAAVSILSGVGPNLADQIAEKCLLAGAVEYFSKQSINEDAASLIRALRRIHLANLGRQRHAL